MYSVRDYPGESVLERLNQEGKTNLDLLEQEIVSGSGISLAYATLTPFDLLQGLPLWVTRGFTSSPIVHIHRVPHMM